jgi:hypothetical protein
MLLPVFWIFGFEYSQTKIVHNFMKTIGTQPINLAFENLTIKTIQNNENTMSLNAPFAKIHDLKLSRIDLQSPIMTLLEKNHPPKLLSADEGFYERKDNQITILKNVKLSEKGTFKIASDKMLVDLNHFTIKLPNGINATYKNNSLKAKDVEFQQKSNKAIFKGGVKLVIEPVGL